MKFVFPDGIGLCEQDFHFSLSLVGFEQVLLDEHFDIRVEQVSNTTFGADEARC